MSEYYVCCSTDGKGRRISTTFDNVWDAFKYVAYHYETCYAPHMSVNSETKIVYTVFENDVLVTTFGLVVSEYMQLLSGKYRDGEVYLRYDNDVRYEPITIIMDVAEES